MHPRVRHSPSIFAWSGLSGWGRMWYVISPVSMGPRSLIWRRKKPAAGPHPTQEGRRQLAAGPRMLKQHGAQVAGLSQEEARKASGLGGPDQQSNSRAIPSSLA